MLMYGLEVNSFLLHHLLDCFHIKRRWLLTSCFQESTHLVLLVLLVGRGVLEPLEVLLECAEIRLVGVYKGQELVADVRHLANIGSHTHELLNFIHHFVAATNDSGDSFNLVDIVLCESLALFHKLKDIFTHWLIRLWQFLLFVD